jgi:hypothetical protein
MKQQKNPYQRNKKMKDNTNQTKYEKRQTIIRMTHGMTYILTTKFPKEKGVMLLT